MQCTKHQTAHSCIIGWQWWQQCSRRLHCECLRVTTPQLSTPAVDTGKVVGSHASGCRYIASETFVLPQYQCSVEAEVAERNCNVFMSFKCTAGIWDPEHTTGVVKSLAKRSLVFEHSHVYLIPLGSLVT